MIFAVRDLQPSSTGLEGAFRVHVLPEHLDQAGLKLGDLCEITADDGKVVGYGVSWRAKDQMGTNPKAKAVKMTAMLRTALGLEAGSLVNLRRTDTKVVLADKVVLTDVTPNDDVQGHEMQWDDGGWPIRIAYALLSCEIFASGIAFDVNMKKGLRRRFRIDHISSQDSLPDPPSLYRLDAKAEIVLNDTTSSPPPERNFDLDIDDALTQQDIGGLQRQIQELNRRLKRAIREASKSNNFHSIGRTNESILIHGFEGTGKSLLLEQLEQFKVCNVMCLNDSKLEGFTTAKKKEIIKDIFKDARMKQPSLILMDDIHEIAPANDKTLVNIINEELKNLIGSRVLVLATCRSPADVNSALLSSRGFTALIELPVPGQQEREQILNSLISNEHDPNGALAKDLSAITHGFTGSDLAKLRVVAGSIAMDRLQTYEKQLRRDTALSGSTETLMPEARDTVENGQLSCEGDTAQASPSKVKPAAIPTPSSAAVTPPTNGHTHASIESDNTSPTLTPADLTAALAKVRPTALREIIFEPPKTTFADIGGSQSMQDHLDKIMLWPLKHKAKMDRLNTRPKKGVMLYGPPGCSKTLTAQAVANKYGLNFIAIKGGELISKYVGESEREMRELFRKARAARPCVIFFDEIDSIASQREATAANGLNVLTTLLTEMDGFNSSEGVIVLAATNRPQILDPAIMRPGRFDAHIYLGLPNAAARKEIFMIRCKGTPMIDTIDFDKLAKDTEGYTGAEIAHIYELAADSALERSISGDEDGATMAEFESALQQTRPQVSREALAVYEAFSSGAGVVS